MPCNKAALKMKTKIQRKRNTWGWERGSKKEEAPFFLCVGKHPRLNSGNSDVGLWPFPRDPHVWEEMRKLPPARSQGPPTPQVLRPPVQRHTSLCAQRCPETHLPLTFPELLCDPRGGEAWKGKLIRCI